jgi:hypothetical protein
MSKDKLYLELMAKTDKFQSEMKRARSTMTGMQKASVALKAGIAAAFAGVALIAVNKFNSFINEANDLWIEQRRIQRQVAQTIKTTGGVAGLTAQEIYEMASALQSVTNYGDEVILTGQNILLTFKNIGKDIFPEVTEIMLDMAATMGTDLKSAAVQLGKALNDPKRGLSALTRVGVTFTDKQKELVKSLVDSGKSAEAQLIILRELQFEFGGAAKAAAVTKKQFKNVFGDLQEEIGGVIDFGLEPMYKWLKDITEQAIKAVKQFRLMNSNLDSLDEAELKIRRAELISQRAIIEARRGEFNSETGEFELSRDGKTGRVSVAPGVTKSWNQLEKEIASVNAQLDKVDKKAEGALAPVIDIDEYGDADKVRKDRIKSFELEKKIELERARDAREVNRLEELSVANEIAQYKLAQYKVGEDGYKEALYAQLQASNDFADEVQKQHKQTQEDIKDTADAFGDAVSGNLRRLAEGTQTVGGMIHNLMLDFAEMQIKTGLSNLYQQIATPGQDIGFNLPFFGGGNKTPQLAPINWPSLDTGGIVPGRYMQPSPIIAHGGEEVLRPDNPRHRNNIGGGSGETVLVYAPNVQTQASAEGVFRVLEEHKTIFFGMIAEGNRTDPNLRNS